MKKYSSKTFLASAIYALNGLRLTFKSEKNFRKHLIIFSCIFLTAVFLKMDLISFCIIILTNGTVLVSEIFNSSIEFTVDAYFKNKQAKLAKIAKDMAAGAVLLASSISMAICLLLIINRACSLITVM